MSSGQEANFRNQPIVTISLESYSTTFCSVFSFMPLICCCHLFLTCDIFIFISLLIYTWRFSCHRDKRYWQQFQSKQRIQKMHFIIEEKKKMIKFIDPSVTFSYTDSKQRVKNWVTMEVLSEISPRYPIHSIPRY